RDLVKRLSGIYRNRCPVNPKSAGELCQAEMSLKSPVIGTGCFEDDENVFLFCQPVAQLPSKRQGDPIWRV
ncbi:hypothetical protein, partial [Agrobacterium pusense]|uniref:hypothetical protein n=1 Tax=Agrobacterium pusense TaxID=648995 RepID=UPI001AECA0CC